MNITGAMVFQMLLMFGPAALEIIEELVRDWNKTMTPEELRVWVVSKRKTRQEWLAWAATQGK